MAALLKHLNPGGESVTTNESDDRLVLNDGIIITPFGVRSLPSYTCRHCNHVLPIKSVADVVEHCGHCRAAICNSCAQKLWTGEDTCRPFSDAGGDLDLYERGKIKVLL